MGVSPLKKISHSAPFHLAILSLFFCLSASLLPAAVVAGSSRALHPSPKRSLQLYSMNHPAMGTIYSLYLYAHSRAEADADAAAVFNEVDRVEDLLSNYQETSELSRINRDAATSDVTTDPETFHFLQTSFAWSARSSGAFDITVGKLMKVWGFFKAKGTIPTEAELARVRSEVGWQRVQLNSAQRTVRFLSPGVELDPGGIGKGYAVERSVKIMREQGVVAALLSAGSSTMYALGAPPGQPGWKIRVPALGHADSILSTVILRDTSLSTANCSEKNFTRNGHLYCSIMDPHTLRPVEGMLQVTVISPSATDSDALSNVLFVLSPKDSASLLQNLPQDSALIVSGKTNAAQCETLRWSAAIASGYCTNANTAKEN